MTRTNAFEALCEVAAQENWCWKIHCSTCGGHHYFRYAFRDLAGGGDPSSAFWRTRKDNHHELEQFLGPPPSLFKWPLPEQESLIAIFSQASLSRIATTANHPDWLGYLGLALFHTDQVERRHRSLTLAWIPQLLELARPDAHSRIELEAILEHKSRTLSWIHLGQIEYDVLAEGNWA